MKITQEQFDTLCTAMLNWVHGFHPPTCHQRVGIRVRHFPDWARQDERLVSSRVMSVFENLQKFFPDIPPINEVQFAACAIRYLSFQETMHKFTEEEKANLDADVQCRGGQFDVIETTNFLPFNNSIHRWKGKPDEQSPELVTRLRVKAMLHVFGVELP